jgi:hypothetical protein
MSTYLFWRRHSRIAFALALAILLAIVVLPAHSNDDLRQQHAAPTLTAIAISVREVDLAWSATSDVFSYTIQRDGALLATLYSDVGSYVDTDVQPSAVYTYTVAALYTDRVESPPSQPVVLHVPALPETPDTTSPSPPTALAAVARDGAVALDWQDATDDSDITVYQIRRDGLLLATVNSGTLSYIDTTALPMTTYIYTVEALDVMGQHSRLSNLVTITASDNPYPYS